MFIQKDVELKNNESYHKKAERGGFRLFLEEEHLHIIIFYKNIFLFRISGTPN